MIKALTDIDYRRATWILIFVSVGNQMAGINILTVYATSIFDDCAKGGGPASFSPKACTYFTGMSGFLGAFLSNFSVKRFSRKQIFIGGHVSIGVNLLLVAICIINNQGNLVLLFMCLSYISF